MKRLLAPVQPPPGPRGSARARQAHPLLSAFPLTVMMLGTLLVLFALTMTLSADADGAVRPSTAPHSVQKAGSDVAAAQQPLQVVPQVLRQERPASSSQRGNLASPLRTARSIATSALS